MIAFEEVSYRYPNTEETAVRNLSFRVEPGELKVVTGASGCGKTTLMRLANGIAPQILGGEVTGTVRIDDCDVSETPVADLAEKVGTLFQDPEEQFFALNVGDEITFALKSRGMTPDDVNARLERAAETLGITHLLDADIHSLSEGQKQKVGLAGILALGPKVLVLDEPSANLDPEATEQLAKILDELKRAGSAILVVDHRLYWLRDTADEVFVMQAGEIRERGPFSILEDDALRARWGLRRDAVADPRATLPRVKVEEGLCAEEKAGAVFTAEKLSFGYPGRGTIFADAAFAVPAGITALIGDNGTGKTTLARILTGLLKAEGTFALDGNAVGKEGLMPSAGLVLQNADHQLTMRTVEEEIIAAMLAGR
ncbi:MAG TPA: ABC transporter ATP-binding protein, partial [Candidatus Sutterella merdavium]|nr:ABC transporter ATP-binding protein [Candidatus Sutterella merdavium]